MTRSKPYLGDLWSFCHGPWFLTLLVYIFVYLYRNDRLVFDKHIIFFNKCFFQYFPSSPVLFLSPFHCCRSALGTFITWFGLFLYSCASVVICWPQFPKWKPVVSAITVTHCLRSCGKPVLLLFILLSFFYVPFTIEWSLYASFFLFLSFSIYLKMHVFLVPFKGKVKLCVSCDKPTFDLSFQSFPHSVGMASSVNHQFSFSFFSFFYCEHVSSRTVESTTLWPLIFVSSNHRPGCV